MTKKYRSQIAIRLPIEVFEIIDKRAKDERISRTRAVEEIVLEWSELKENDPSKTSPKSPDLTEISEKLDTMQIQLLTIQQIFINVDVTFTEDE